MTILFITYCTLLFVVLTLVGVLVFYAINKVTRAQWSTDLYPLMQRITSPLWLFSVLLLAVLYFYRNDFFFLLRSIGYLVLWVGYRFVLAKRDTFTKSVVFLVLFFLTESPMVWDWFLSLTPHWNSTLSGWYVLSSFLLSGVAFVTLFSKPTHYSDMGKYLFGFSMLWAYLWYSQYMLIWYANIPEEMVYYQTLISKGYSWAIITMLLLCFGIPFLCLLSSRAKRQKALLFGVAVLILIGQYLNFYLMVMPFV